MIVADKHARTRSGKFADGARLSVSTSRSHYRARSPAVAESRVWLLSLPPAATMSLMTARPPIGRCAFNGVLGRTLLCCVFLVFISSSMALQVGTPPFACRDVKCYTRSLFLSRRQLLSGMAVSVAMPLIINAPLPASASSSGFEQVADLGAEAKALRAAVRSGAPETRAKSQGYADLKSQVEKQKTAVLLPLQVRLADSYDSEDVDGKTRTCVQAAMATAAPSAGLTADNQKRLELLPLLMKGHLLELDQAAASAWAPHILDVPGIGQLSRRLSATKASHTLKFKKGTAQRPVHHPLPLGALAESKFDEYVSKTTKATYTGGKADKVHSSRLCARAQAAEGHCIVFVCLGGHASFTQAVV
eukprot:816804-Pleurochrysis_carterae.AAC.3